MKILTLFAVLFFSLPAVAQDQPGYYITSDGQRAEGFFRTSNFYNSDTLEFRKAEEVTYIKINTDSVTEYGISDEFKFRKFNVPVGTGTSSNVFFNVIVEGNAILYSLHGAEGISYYYTVGGKQEQPVKLEMVPARGKEARKHENNRFKDQLKQDVSCPGSSIDFDRLQYKERDLADVFTQYNTCTGGTQIVYKNSSARTNRIHFTLFAGLYNNNYNIENMSIPYEDANTLSAGLGVEAAYRFPSEIVEVFAKLEFENFSATIKKDFPQPSGYITNYFDINTSVLNLYLGPRLNLKLNESNKIFADVAFGLSVPFGKMSESSVLTEGTVVTNQAREEHTLDTTLCGNFGLGYVYKGKYGVVIRYETNREFFNRTNTGYTGEFKRIGINLSYTFN